MSKRRQEQIQLGKGKPMDTNVARTPDAAKAPALGGEQAVADPLSADANALGKYWIAIIVWGACFTVLILFEVFAAVFRR